MAFITTEQTKTIREKIKAEFPANEGWKFSITCKNYSCLYIHILQAPFDFDISGRSEKSLIHYSDFKEYPPEQAEVLKKLGELARSEGWYDDSDSHQEIENIAYYIWMHIGHWDKGFKYVEMPKNTAKKRKINSVPSIEPIKTEGLELVKYSDKCYALFGDTKPYKEILGYHGLKCAFNYKLVHPVTKDKTPGWLVNNAKLERVKHTLSL